MKTDHFGELTIPVTDDGKARIQIETSFDYGLTLRDYFAARAMQGMLANKHVQHAYQARDTNMFARDAYALADAMLAEREGGEA